MSAGIQIVNSDQNKESCDAIDRFLESLRVGTARYAWWFMEQNGGAGREVEQVGQTFLKKPDWTDVVTQAPGKVVVPNKCV